MLFFASGAGGVVNTAMPLDFITHDSYFVVGHFHLLLMGTVSLTFTGFIYYLFPLITGRMYNEKWAKIHFIFSFRWHNFGIYSTTFLGTLWNAKKSV